MQRKIPAVIMRGGTSKGVFFHDNHLPDDMAMHLARVRELTEQPVGEETVPPPSIETGEKMLAALQALIELGHQKVVEVGL